MSAVKPFNVDVRLVGFLPSDHSPEKALVHGTVLSVEGIPANLASDVLVSMDGLVKDANRLVQDLCLGASTFDVPKCFTGATVRFEGCEMLNGDEIFAASYVVVDDGLDAESDFGATVRQGFEASRPEAPAMAM